MQAMTKSVRVVQLARIESVEADGSTSVAYWTCPEEGPSELVAVAAPGPRCIAGDSWCDSRNVYRQQRCSLVEGHAGHHQMTEEVPPCPNEKASSPGAESPALASGPVRPPVPR